MSKIYLYISKFFEQFGSYKAGLWNFTSTSPVTMKRNTVLRFLFICFSWLFFIYFLMTQIGHPLLRLTLSLSLYIKVFSSDHPVHQKPGNCRVAFHLFILHKASLLYYHICICVCVYKYVFAFLKKLKMLSSLSFDTGTQVCNQKLNKGHKNFPRKIIKKEKSSLPLIPHSWPLRHAS